MLCGENSYCIQFLTRLTSIIIPDSGDREDLYLFIYATACASTEETSSWVSHFAREPVLFFFAWWANAWKCTETLEYNYHWLCCSGTIWDILPTTVGQIICKIFSIIMPTCLSNTKKITLRTQSKNKHSNKCES